MAAAVEMSEFGDLIAMRRRDAWRARAWFAAALVTLVVCRLLVEVEPASAGWFAVGLASAGVLWTWRTLVDAERARRSVLRCRWCCLDSVSEEQCELRLAECAESWPGRGWFARPVDQCSTAHHALTRLDADECPDPVQTLEWLQRLPDDEAVAAARLDLTLSDRPLSVAELAARYGRSWGWATDQVYAARVEGRPA